MTKNLFTINLVNITVVINTKDQQFMMTVYQTKTVSKQKNKAAHR